MFLRFFIALFLMVHTAPTASAVAGVSKPELCTIYAHGVVDGPSQAKRFQDAFATHSVRTVCFPDSLPALGWGLNGCIGKVARFFARPVNRLSMHMGQGQDLKAFDKAVLEKIDDNLILYGCSRGAGACVNYLAQTNDARVQAVVLDACPADISATIKRILARLGINPDHSLYIFRKLFPSYPARAITPLQAVVSIKNKNLPILLIHSQTDTVVPFVDSLKMFAAFKKQGFTSVYLAKIPHGRHSFLLQDAITSRSHYLAAVHNFYRMHGLPCDAQWSMKNYEFYQPTDQETSQAIAAHESFTRDMYHQACTRNKAVSAVALVAALAAMYAAQRSA